MRWLTIIIILLALPQFQACSTSRVVKPLDPGKISLSADAGGPIFNYQGNDIPMPLSSISAAYGVNRNYTVFTGLHTTQAVYGVMHTDIGVLKNIRRPSFYIPGISITPAINLMIDTWEKHFKAYPSIDINAYWPVYDRKDYIYLGMSNWFELATERAHGEKQPTHWVPAIHSGYTFIPGKMNYTLEAKYLAPFHSNKDIVVEYMSPTDRGAIGIYLRVGYTF